MESTKNSAIQEIENARIDAHKWLLNSFGAIFLVWSAIDFYNNETLAPIFLMVRLLILTLVILFSTPLNNALFSKYHRAITSSIITLISSTSLIFTLLSEHSYTSNIFFFISFYISTALLFQANHRYYLPTLIIPILLMISSKNIINNENIIFEYSLLKLIFLSSIVFIARLNISKFAENTFKLRLKFEENKNETQKLLEENNQLVRILCHDLGNALTIIEMSTSMLENHITLPNDQKLFFDKNIDRLKRAVTNQKEIIDHVKQKEALESGKQKVELTPVSLNIIFEKVKFIFQDQLKDKHIELNFNYSNDKSPYVTAEMVSLSNNVINNIVSNAIKFSPDYNQIMISTWSDKEFIFVTIEDFGIGMDEDLVKNIFSTTVKTSRPGVRGEKGTGFGMPLAKSYMLKYGGDIIVESKMGKGTRFTLKFKGIESLENQGDDFKLVS